MQWQLLMPLNFRKSRSNWNSIKRWFSSNRLSSGSLRRKTKMRLKWLNSKHKSHLNEKRQWSWKLSMRQKSKTSSATKKPTKNTSVRSIKLQLKTKWACAVKSMSPTSIWNSKLLHMTESSRQNKMLSSRSDDSKRLKCSSSTKLWFLLPPLTKH